MKKSEALMKAGKAYADVINSTPRGKNGTKARRLACADYKKAIKAEREA